MVTLVLTVGGNNYAQIIDLSLRQSIANYARQFMAVLADSDASKFAAISQNDDVQITVDGTLRFRGTIESKKRTEDKRLIIKGRDYYLEFLSKVISSKSYTSQTASQILTDLVTSYTSLGTSGIQATSNLYNRIYKLNSINFAVAELQELERFVCYVDDSLDVHYEPENFTDSGKHYTSSQVLDTDYESKITQVVNQIIVVYGTNLDKSIRRRNDASISAYRLKEKIELKKNISSETDALDFADSFLSANSEPSEPIIVTIKLDASFKPGQIVHLPIGVANRSESDYLILEAEHNFAPPSTKLKLGIFTKDTADVLIEIIRKLRITDEDKISSTLAITTINDVSEDLTAKVYCTVNRRTISGALVGEFTCGQKRIGQLSGAYTTLVNNQQAILPNKGIEGMMRIWSQLATVPTIFDSGNAYIAVGSGSATALVTDTVLNSESDRQAVAAGSPHANGAGRLVWEFTFGDAELLTATLREFGLFNDSAAGEMLAKYVHTSNISKAANEEVEVKIELVLTGTNATTPGLNLLRDLIAGFSLDYLDNAGIELVGSTTYRKLVNSFQFLNANYDEIVWQIRVTNPGDIATGSTITGIDLYSESSGGVQVIDTAVATITTIASEDNVIRQKIKVNR